MSYRDDADALFSRNEALQRELDELKAQLAERDAPKRALPNVPALFADNDSGRHFGQPTKVSAPAEETMARLISGLGGIGTSDVSAYPRLPDPPAAAVQLPEADRKRRDKLLDLTRARLGGLTDEQLVLLGAVIEALFEERSDVMISLRDAARLALEK